MNIVEIIFSPTGGTEKAANTIRKARLKQITGNGAMVSAAALAIKKTCSVRKENELFL